MNPTADSRGTMVQGRGVWSIRGALVEEVHTTNGRTGHVMISYAVPGPGGLTSIELLRLNVNPNTIVVNSFWMPFCLCDLRPGMWIDTDFSPMMTRSIPPQTNAFRIVVQRRGLVPLPPSPPPPAFPEFITLVDRVVSVEPQHSFFVTGNPYDFTQQMRLTVSDATVIVDRSGNRIPLRSLQPGQLVEVQHATFQTASIPPQTAAFQVRVL